MSHLGGKATDIQSMYRHRVFVRVVHWVNAVAFLVLVVSGVGILVAHPQFYWGEAGHYPLEPWLKILDAPIYDLTSWGRNLHFLFAWIFVLSGLVYVVKAVATGHLKKDLLPSRTQIRWVSIVSEIRRHLTMRRPETENPLEFNVLQKLAYLTVVFILCPLMVLTGLTMAPGVVAAFHWLPEIFGGRQSARTIHFLAASGLLLFFVVHLMEVFRVGAVKAIKGMISGYVKIDKGAA